MHCLTVHRLLFEHAAIMLNWNFTSHNKSDLLAPFIEEVAI